MSTQESGLEVNEVVQTLKTMLFFKGESNLSEERE